MSQARIEILRMIAEGKVSPEDGERLLDALDAGMMGGGSSAHEAGRRESGRVSAENLGRAFEDAARAVKSAATEGVRAAQRVFDEHRPETTPVPLEHDAFDIVDGGTLRIQPALRVSIGGGSAGSSVTVRGIPGTQARVLEGAAIEVHRNESDYILTWAKSGLVVEVPETLARLVVRSFGNVQISNFDRAFRVESFGGNVAVIGATAPFKIRALAGSVRVLDLSVAHGASAIRCTGGDIEVTPTADASVEVHAAASLGGELELPRNAVRMDSKTRRRGVVSLGGGKARLELDTLSGSIRVHADHLDTSATTSRETQSDPRAATRSESTRGTEQRRASHPYTERPAPSPPAAPDETPRPPHPARPAPPSGGAERGGNPAEGAPPPRDPDLPPPDPTRDSGEDDPWMADWWDDREPPHGGAR